MLKSVIQNGAWSWVLVLPCLFLFIWSNVVAIRDNEKRIERIVGIESECFISRSDVEQWVSEVQQIGKEAGVEIPSLPVHSSPYASEL